MARDDDRKLQSQDNPGRDLDCERCEPLLSSYLLEELTPSEREQVGSHLGGCGKCRDELDLLKATAEALAKSPLPGDPPVGVEREPLLRKARSHQRAPTPLWWAAAAAAVLAVAGTSIAIFEAGRRAREISKAEIAVRSEEKLRWEIQSRSRLEAEQLPPAPVAAAVPLPAVPQKPGDAAAGGRKAGLQPGVAEQEVTDVFSGWPLLAKTNEDGAAPMPESRALKLAPDRVAALPRAPFGAAGGVNEAPKRVFEKATAVPGATEPSPGPSPAKGLAALGEATVARRKVEQEVLTLQEQTTEDARRPTVDRALGLQVAPGQRGRFGGAQAGASGPDALTGLAGVPGGGAAPGPVSDSQTARKTSLEYNRRVLTPLSPDQKAESKPLQVAGGTGAGGKKATDGFNKELATAPEARWKERVDDIFIQLDRQPGETPEKMFFRYWATNPFQEAGVQPLSTFSVDVDTASYTIFRSYLYSSGVLPPREAIRTEEFLNYFKTDYAPPPPAPKPDGEGSAFAINVEMAPNPFAKDEEHRFLRIGIKGREVSKGQRRACGLVFVIDTSGSMRRENRLGLVKEGLRLLVNELDEGDTVGIIAFDREARTILEPAPASEKERILAAIGALEPRQNTNVAAGLKSGYAMAAAHRLRGGSNRVILLSDGVANTGNTDPQEMLREVQEEREKGIYLTCVGVGMGNLNDALLEDLADKGDGQCRYVDRPEEAHRIFVESLTGTLEPIARNVKVQVEFDPAKVIRYRLLGYEKRDLPAGAFRDSGTKAGLVGAGHSVTAFYDVKPKGSVEGRIATVRLRLQTIDHGEAQEMTREVLGSDHRRAFTEASPRFQLAACVAQAAEVLRDSYWARGVNLGQVLSRLGTVAPLLKDDRDVMELVALLTRADALLRARQSTEDDVARVRTLDALKDNLYLRASIEDGLKSRAGPGQEAGPAPERSPEDVDRLRKLDEIRRQNEDLRRQLEALIAK